jgi:hypothetical protein
VLGDPARRAAYDQALAREPTPPPASRPPGPPAVTPAARMPGPPLWAGPVRVGGQRQAPVPGGPDAEEFRLAVLAGLALRSLTHDWDWPW